MSLQLLLFTIILTLETILGTNLIVSLIKPKHRIWPPPKKHSWQYYTIHTITETSIFFYIILGLFDYNTFIITHQIRFLVSTITLAPAVTLFLWAFQTLTIETSLGLKGKLTTKGPYKHSRNPQYIATTLFFIGTILLFNSFYTTITGLIGIILFLITPFVEEPWLKKQYKQEYAEYTKKVPRYL
jgi:protein-S-isoprenylcysteine O-methyltransferase Ste14